MKVFEQETFGTTPAGEAVRSFRLEGGQIRAEVLSYGAVLRVLETDGRDGPVDVALGYDTLEDYVRGDKYLGAIVGRCANRIAGGRFALNGRPYTLAQNDGNNHLHGGLCGFSHRLWTPNICSDGLHLTRESADGEEGYPGSLRADVIYAIEDDGALSISYRAVCDQDTICNLTNHTYFNLAGAGRGDIMNQALQLFSDFYTPLNDQNVPGGSVLPVADTPMDFRELTPIGARIDDDFAQLKQAGGYDHNWVVRGNPNELRPAARAMCAETGLLLEAWTTQPGLQFYAANFLAGGPKGKGGAVYGNRSAFCLETQDFPNAINCPSFPQPVLKKGAIYQHKTLYYLKRL